MLLRTLAEYLPSRHEGYPAIAITGPRQSGKTTLAKTSFPALPFVNLESPIERAQYRSDPAAFLARFPQGAVIDEVQNEPTLFSLLQVRIDEDRESRWVLTGSQQFDLGRGIAQSLAGRIAIMELMPFSLEEVADSDRKPRTLAEAVLLGGYPPLFDDQRRLDAAEWLENYLTTFLSRDLRHVLQVRDRAPFDRMVRLCAARTGQILNMSELARDCAVDAKTISAWLGVLEACYILKVVRPHHRNFGKRIVKSPKLYFLDSGVACRLLYLTDVNQLRSHPLWGALVETWCFGEVLKSRVHRALSPDLWFWRSGTGVEVDFVIEVGGGELLPIEVKASQTPNPRDVGSIQKVRAFGESDPMASLVAGYVIYGGSEALPAGVDQLLPWNQIDPILRERW